MSGEHSTTDGNGAYRVRFAPMPRAEDGVGRALRRAYHPADTLPRDMTDLLSRLK